MDSKYKTLVAACLVYLILIMLAGCGSSVSVNTSDNMRGSYPAALMWDGICYSPGTGFPIDKKDIGELLGEITGQGNDSMSLANGEIRYSQDFQAGTPLFSIKGMEITEAIAARKGDKYYRLDAFRSSLAIIWDDKVYHFTGNFDKENEASNIERQLGEIKRSGIRYEDAANGDIVYYGDEAEPELFPAGGKIYSLKDTRTDRAVAVQGKDGKYHKAVYIKKFTK